MIDDVADADALEPYPRSFQRLVPAAAAGFVIGLRRRERLILMLGLITLAWLAADAALAATGYPADVRFVLPADVVVSVLGASAVNAVLSIALVFVPRVARVVRSAVLGLRTAEFVEAAQVRGERASWIVTHEILPNLWPPIIVEACVRMSFSVAAA